MVVDAKLRLAAVGIEPDATLRQLGRPPDRIGCRSRPLLEWGHMPRYDPARDH